MSKANIPTTLIRSRRAVLSGLAAGGATVAASIPTAALMAAAEPDPIYAAIERHKDLAKTYDAAVKVRGRFKDFGTLTEAEEARLGELNDALDEAHLPLEAAAMDLFNTHPTTQDGITTALFYMRLQCRNDGMHMIQGLFEDEDGERYIDWPMRGLKPRSTPRSEGRCNHERELAQAARHRLGLSASRQRFRCERGHSRIAEPRRYMAASCRSVPAVQSGLHSPQSGRKGGAVMSDREISQEAKTALANASRRKAADRLRRDGCQSMDAVRRRVRAVAEERQLQPAEYAKLMHKRISTAAAVDFCDKHKISMDWLLCGDPGEPEPA